MSAAPARVGLFTGAGLSHAAPAGVPLGETFHHLVHATCWAAAREVGGEVVDRATFDALRAMNWNLLARIENTVPGAGAAALACMAVGVPNEAHLLAAVHLARGGLHVTVNFDDGVESAYRLLAGRAALPENAPAAYRDALAAWRAACFPADAPPLRVVPRAGAIAAALGRRPLLVKLHGSLGRHADGVTLPLRSVTDEPDAADLGGQRRAAYDALAGEGFVLVTGFSAADLATSVPLLERLGRGRFWWVAPDVRPEIRPVLAAIDPRQPVPGRAVAALRAVLALEPPTWPAEPTGSPTVEDRLADWAAALPVDIAAEAYAWALADAGRADQAVPLLERLVAGGGRSGTRARLADALAARAGPADGRAAARHYARAVFARGGRGHGPYAVGRWAELESHDPASAVGRLALAGLGVTIAGRRHPGGRTRAATVVGSILLAPLERQVPGALASPARRASVGALARLGGRTVGWALARSAHAASGRRRAVLLRQRLEFAAIDALARGAAPPASAQESLRRLRRMFEHLDDPPGVAETIRIEALVSVGASEPRLARAAAREADRISPRPTALQRALRRLLAATPGAGLGQPSGSASPVGSSSTASSVPSRTSSSPP